MFEKNLIIGLGGCGGRSIQELRRIVALHSDEYAHLRAKNVELDYLYIDSNNDILNSDGWSVSGKSIKLEARQVIELKQSGMPDIDLVSGYTSIKPWIGDIKDNYSKRSSGQSDEVVKNALQSMAGAGQLRRYGRLLFALNLACIRRVFASSLERLSNHYNGGVHVHIFASVCGGTGSGCLIDTITLIKQLEKRCGIQTSVDVYLYAESGDWHMADIGMFSENAYCTLRDLNALMVGKYFPSLQDDTEMRDVEKRAILFDNVNLAHVSLRLDEPITGHIKNFANACWDKIVCGCNYINHDALRPLVGMDLIMARPGEADAQGNIVKSYRFSALCSKRLSIPTKIQQESLVSVTKARIYKTLLEGEEGAESADNSATPACDYFSTTLERRLGDWEKSILQPIENLLSDALARKMKGINAPYELRCQAEKQIEIFKSQCSNARVISELDAVCQKSVESAVAHFERELCEKALFSRNGKARGLNWVEKAIDFAKSELYALKNRFASLSENGAEQRAQTEQQLQHREGAWNSMGLFSKLFGSKREKLATEQCSDACRLVALAFIPLRAHFVEKFVENVLVELNRVGQLMASFTSRLSNAVSGHERESSLILDEIKWRDSSTKYIFNEKAYKLVRKAMETEETVFHGHIMTDVREKLNTCIQVEGGLSSLSYHIANVLDEISCYDYALHLHDAACREASLSSMWTGDIMEELAQLGGKDMNEWERRIGGLIHEFCSQMPGLAHIDNRNGLTEPQVSPLAAVYVAIPHNVANPALEEWLKSAIRRYLPSKFDVLPSRVDIFTHSCVDEIRLLYMTYWMPCKFFPVARLIEKRYQESLKNGRDEVMYFANCDSTGEDKSPEFARPALT